MHTLRPKQEAFAQNFVIDWNATQAAVRAGYSERTAQEQASRLLSKVMIKDRVDELAEQAAERNEITVDWVLERLTKESLTAKTDGARVRALELVGKYLAMFVDRQQVEGGYDQLLDDEVAQKYAKTWDVPLADVRSKLGLPSQEIHGD